MCVDAWLLAGLRLSAFANALKIISSAAAGRGAAF